MHVVLLSWFDVGASGGARPDRDRFATGVPGYTRRMPRSLSTPSDAHRIEAARQHAIALLQRNLGPHGIRAASRSARAQARGYEAIFGRDAAVCALGMALSGDATLASRAADGLLTLARHQAPNGQMPKFVDAQRREADFWYLGCIDSTLWWLIAVDYLAQCAAPADLREQMSVHIHAALRWLACQEHQRFHLLMQGEASDWADIMPRSGFVLYTNALWYRVKRLYRLPHAQRTRRSFNQLFHPFSAPIAEYRRARLLTGYVTRGARNRDLYLSFVNFSFFGDEGDVFGNLLAVLFGLPEPAHAQRVVRALLRRHAADPYPIRAVCDPIGRDDTLWREYMDRHRQNLAWQYHNGGIWPFVGGFWVTALAQLGREAEACNALAALARVNALDGWQFNEWLHGRTLQPRGMPGQSWNAASYLMAYAAVRRLLRRPLASNRSH
jgi:glycogen debranching enzyme